MILPGRVAAWLEHHLRLNSVRVEVRGRDAEVDSALNAIRLVAVAWRNTNSVPGRKPPEVAEEMPSFYNTTAAATYLGITDRGVRQAIKDGRLEATQTIDGRHQIHAEDLLHFAASRRAA
jgi:excisionase family DNA binding protein